MLYIKFIARILNKWLKVVAEVLIEERSSHSTIYNVFTLQSFEKRIEFTLRLMMRLSILRKHSTE